MKKYAILVLGTVFMFSSAIIAQEQTPTMGRKGDKKEIRKGERPEMTSEKRAEMMAKELGLTPSEKVKVQSLIEKQDVVRKQHREEMKKQHEEQMAKAEIERKTQETELIKIIGNEKFQKMQSMKIERMKKMLMMKEKRNHRNGEGFQNRKACPEKAEN